ncbi:hypothetical protein Dimus_005119, partial [Dionaea muscipula]
MSELMPTMTNAPLSESSMDDKEPADFHVEIDSSPPLISASPIDAERIVETLIPNADMPANCDHPENLHEDALALIHPLPTHQGAQPTAAEQQSSNSAADLKHHVWRPKKRPKNTTWKRIPVMKAQEVDATPSQIDGSAQQDAQALDPVINEIPRPHRSVTAPGIPSIPSEPDASSPLGHSHEDTPNPDQPRPDLDGFLQ